MTPPQHSFTVYLPLPMRRAACREQQWGAPQPTPGKWSPGLDSLLTYVFSSQMVAVQRSWVSQSSSKSGVTKPLPSEQHARGLFDLLFVHDFHSSPSRGTCCPVEESPPSRDTAQTLGGCSSAHMFLDSKFAKVHAPSPLLSCVMLGVLAAALQVPVVGRKEGSTQHRSSQVLGYITSL